jgi:UDP-4-amino-4,6-dideoxy-N-acetyl-beta-L-altrosamine N-acetyltransferase
MNHMQLVPLSQEYLGLVLEWRNKPEIRKNMYTTHEITKEEHKSWFNGLCNDLTRRYFVFELDGNPCGVIGFVDINKGSKSASWAFYSGDTSVRGIGSMMEIAALDYAFNTLELNKLFCEVLEFNESVIKFHKKHGFQVEGVFRKQHSYENKLWDIYRLAIFKDDWIRCSDEIKNRVKGRLSPGSSYEYKFVLSNDQVRKFAEVSGDNNKIHRDDEFAKEFGFKGRLVHGFLAGSIFSNVFGTVFPGEGTVYINQSMNFIKPIYPNDELEAVFRVESKIGRKLVVSTSVYSSEGEAIVGVAELLVPESLL